MHILVSTRVKNSVNHRSSNPNISVYNCRNPYPRPVNLPPGSYTKQEGKKTGSKIERLNEMSKPIYIKSIDDSIDTTRKGNG